MDRFPDTLFKIAGWLEITEVGGLAIVVFESLENEGSYFVQKVDRGKISDFTRIDRPFRKGDQLSNLLVRREDDAIYLFITQSDVLLGSKQYVSEGVHHALRTGAVSDDVIVEAAYIVGDDDLLLSSLDERYFKLRDKSPKSAEFFRLNNILRDLVISKLANERLRKIADNCQISASGNVVEIRFASTVHDHVSLDEREKLQCAFDEQVKRSRSFSEFGIELQFEFPSFVGARFQEFVNSIKFDLPYSAAFLAREGGREIFIPIGMLPDVFSSVLSECEVESPMSYSVFLGEVLRKFKEFQINPVGFDRSVRAGARAFDLVRARNLALAMMMVAKDQEISEWKRFGRIRCCVFGVRPWGAAPLNSLEGTELFCINALHDRFNESGAQSIMAFDSYFYVANRGRVSQSNFSDLPFGFSNSYLEFLVVAMHGLYDKHDAHLNLAV